MCGEADPELQCFGFRVQDLGFRVQGLGFRGIRQVTQESVSKVLVRHKDP